MREKIVAETKPPKDLAAAYKLFQKFALGDQESYYKSAVKRYRKAGEQANQLRAFFAFLAGVSAALAGLLVAAYLVPGAFANDGICAELPQSTAVFESTEENITIANAPPDAPPTRPTYCLAIEIGVGFLTVLAIIAPVIGAGFTTLADLYQWDRLVTIYDAALENITVADAQSPLDEMDDITYRAALRAYAEGTLSVMRDETAQWGQLIKTPPQLDEFLDEERVKAAKVNGSADDLVPGREAVPPRTPRTPPPPPPDTPLTPDGSGG
jgi:hypothetical protein